VGDWVEQLIWNAIAYAAVAGAGLGVMLGVYLFAPGLHQSWFSLPRLRPGTWTGHDVFLAFCIFLGFPRLIVELLLVMGFFNSLIGLEPDGPPIDKLIYGARCVWICSPLTLAIVLGLLFAMLFARSGTRPHHYGLSWARWPANSGLGLIALIVGKPIVLGIFALALLLFTRRPDPVESLVNLQPPEWEWALLAFQTTVAAPLMEEVVFRGILQGWLRRASLSGHLTFLTMAFFMAIALHSGDLLGNAEQRDYGPAVFAIVMAAGYAFALYRLTDRFRLNEAEVQQWRPMPSMPPLDVSLGATEEEARELRRQWAEEDETRSRRWAIANARFAIFGSAFLFAVVHPWPDALAMFPMGLMLGWLAYRTQSLIGPLVFHMLFNLSTFIALYGSVLSANR
jgi:membrane protease YdiL (CAAX protease family)